MTDREALAQVERLIADCENRIARQREVIASAFQKGRHIDAARPGGEPERLREYG
jgi:hypothetical protein